MLWGVNFTHRAEKNLNELDTKIKKRVLNKILWLKNNFNQIDPLSLSNEWQGFFKLRVGDWRVIYDIDNNMKKITIHRIDKRDKVYKRK